MKSKWLLGAIAAIALLATGAAGASAASPSIEVLSSRPDVVTGGDALVQVSVAHQWQLDDVVVTLNDADVTDQLHDVGGAKLGGVVHGLPLGQSHLRARLRHGGGDQLTLTNFPITGPVFSGPHQQPFVCQTQDFVLPDGSTLGPATDDDCSAPTRVDYLYKSTSGWLTPLADPSRHPADLADTTTSTGATVPYIVRVETGTIDRAIYQTAILDDPSTDPALGPFAHPAGWNGGLVFTFGFGCPGGWYAQGAATGGVTDDFMLGKGFALASSSLNVASQNCNDQLSAEAMDMVKERFVETLGVPRYTMGLGCSGGSYQGHEIGDDYPGLLDGIVVGCSFPDVAFGTVNYVTDARLLDHFFRGSGSGEFTPEQQRAISGFAKQGSIGALAVSGGRIDPRIFCPAALPLALRYDPLTNPTGARCDVYDAYVNQYGRDPATGFARRPLDNVGVQYGLKELNAGTITVDQFLDLNGAVGGFDADANFVAQRTKADPAATRIAYRSGRMLNGGGGLRHMPIIDYREYTDDLDPVGDIHMRSHSFATRARLLAANGTYANQVMLQVPFPGWEHFFSTQNPHLQYALTSMDEWLRGLAGTPFEQRSIGRIVAAKPADLADSCWTRDDAQRIVEPQTMGAGTTACNTLYPVWTSPRMEAGAPVANNQIACRLEPIRWSDYAATFTPQQRARLRAEFPDGVCDWSKPGYAQTTPLRTWMSFGPAHLHG